MSRWTGIFQFQKRSRRNALTAAVGLRRRRAEAAEAERVARAAARAAFLDAARTQPDTPPHSSSPELIPLYEEGERHAADRLRRSETWGPAQGTAFDRDDLT